MELDTALQASAPQSTRDAILDAADEFLKANGFRDLTVSGLMQDTSVSRPAFYQYFRDRYDIAAALIERLAEEVNAASFAWFNSEAPPVQACQDGIAAYTKTLAPHAYIMRAICDASAADERIDRLWWQGLVQRYIDATAARIRKDQEAGFVDPAMDVELISRALVLLTIKFTCDCLGMPECAGTEEFADTLARIWCSAVYLQV